MRWVIDFDYSVKLPDGKIVWRHTRQARTATETEIAEHITLLWWYGSNMKNIEYERVRK